MANFNSVILVGRLTKDPELRYAPSGKAVADIGLAINHTYSTQDGEKKEEVCFVQVVVWGKQAENCSQYLNKGSEVLVEGRLHSSSWETKAGEKRSKLDVTAKHVQFLGKKRDEEG